MQDAQAQQDPWGCRGYDFCFKESGNWYLFHIWYVSDIGTFCLSTVMVIFTISKPLFSCFYRWGMDTMNDQEIFTRSFRYDWQSWDLNSYVHSLVETIWLPIAAPSRENFQQLAWLHRRQDESQAGILGGAWNGFIGGHIWAELEVWRKRSLPVQMGEGHSRHASQKELHQQESGGSDGLEEGLVSSCALLQGLRREELEMEDQSLPPIEFGIDPWVPGPNLVRFSNELFTHLQ